MTISPFSEANSNSSRSAASSSNSDFLDLFQLVRKEKLECSQLQRTFKRLRRGVALGAVLVMFQGSSAALSSAWADGCVDNPTYCVTTDQDTMLNSENQRVALAGSLRSAVETANGSGASSSTIGFADQLFGIVRDPSSGAITNSEANPIIGRTITLDSTLEIRTNLAIKAPTDALGSNILTIERGTSVAAGNPLISVNTPSSQTGPLTNGATAQVQIENVTLDSNANPNTGNLNDPKATAGVTIQVNQTEVTTENGSTLVTPEVVLKSTQVLNAVSETGGAAVNTSGDVRVENSTLVGNMAVSSGDGTASDGGAIKAVGTVTVVSSALNGNSATGNGGAISASTVNVSIAESSSNSQFYGNTAGGSGGAINSSGDTVVNGAVLAGNVAGGIKDDGDPAAQAAPTATGGDGGAINAGGAVVVSGSQLAGNNAFTGTEVNSQSGNGGAISAGAQVAITDSNIFGNKAGNNGGAISTGGGVLVETISNPSPSSISSNRATVGSGGAISAGATVTVTNAVLDGNSAGTDGGAISAASNVLGENAHLAGNLANTNGGAISAGGSVSITTTAGARNSSLSSNQAISGSGGAIDAGVNVFAQNVDMSGNRAGTGGGAIRAAGEVGITTLEGTASSALSGNRAGGDGGAVLAGGDVSVNATQMFGNSAGGNGGAISAGQNPSSVNITSSQLVGNVAGKTINQDVLGGNGGAVNAGGSVVVSNESVIVGNRAYSTQDQTLGNGGAIYATQIVVVQNSELLYSTAGDQGGAIYAGESVAVETSQISGNTSGGNGGAIASGGTVSVTSVDDQVRPALGDIGDARNRSEISGNMAAGHGGAIAAGSTVDVSHSNLINNQSGAAREGGTVFATTSGGDGGAIYSSTNVTVTNTVIGFNSSTGGSGPGRAEGQGGGIAAVGMVVVQGSVISSNSAYGDGGAVKTETIIIAPDISRSEISSNYSEGDGGAISASTVYVVALPGQAFGLETQINNNVSASSGGAIAAMAEINIYRAELNGNIAAGNGGAINSEGAVLISTSTLANNVAGGFPSDEGGIDTSSSGGNGGAIYTTNSVAILQSQFSSNESRAAYHPYDPSNPDVAPSETGGKGGAIYSEEDVHVFDESTFDSNYASHSGGAIVASNLFLTGVVLEGNGTNGQGGAIYTQGESSRTSISLSDFSGNTSFGPGGAIYSEGTVQVYDSVFGLRIDTNQAEGSEPNSESNLAINDRGGAIYAEGDVQIARSIFGGNISGAGGGAIASEGATSVDASLFFLNQSLGNGGAIDSNGIVSIENGSLLVANQAGTINFSGWEFLFPSFYPIFGPGEMYVAPQYGGNGGAIYSNDSVVVRGSSIGTLPPIGAPDASVFSNKALCSGYWSDESVDRYWIQECGFYREDGMWISLGSGGGIYAAGQVIIEGSETDYEFNLQTFSFNSKETSFEYSFLTNNFAQNNGGAVYALGGARVDNAVFGSTPEINPNYNPSRESLNPDYIPGRFERNPLFGNGQPSRIPNDLYDPEVSPTIPNPICEGASQFGGNLNTGESWCVVDGINHPLSIENPDQRWIFDFPNELYSDQEFLYIEAVGEEFLYELDDPTKDQDNYKFNYLGNHSGRDGGAIYVEGSTLITNSIFSGNTSGDDGGAIYSEGALEITDSTFSRNWADDDGGAIKTTPGDGDLLIARTAFTENLAMDDGGAIDISTGEQPHYDDLILSSLFRDNEAFGPGGAIDSSFAILILNTFENNDSPDGHALHLHGGILSGNKLIGTTSSSFQSSLSLCSHPIYTEFNFMTDESCFAEEELVVSNVANVLLSHAQITDPAATLTLPSNYAGTLLEYFKTLSEFYLEAPSESNPTGIVSEFGSFIANELNKDFNLAIRDSAVLWNPGHIQSIFPTSTVIPEVDSPVVDEGTDDQVVVVPPSSNNQDTPILILGPTLSAEELARLAAQRAEQLAAELKRQQEAERVAAERLAKIKADKLARDKVRALAAEKRRAQLAALKAKIAATQARGEALKRKPSWINLMKNSSKSNAAKKLVKVPNK